MKHLLFIAMSCVLTATLSSSCSKEAIERVTVNKGSMIIPGNGAPAADVGGKGDYYLDKLSGKLYGPKTDTGWGNNPIALVEPNSVGNTIYSGTTPPAADKGNIGDLYLQLNSSNPNHSKLYGPKTAEGWGTGYEMGDKSGGQPQQLPNYRLSKDGKTLLAWTNFRTLHLDMRSDPKLANVEHIGDEAFRFSYGESEDATLPYALTTIILSDKVSSIGTNAFGEMAFLESATLPSRLKIVPENCFLYCKKLKSVNLSEGIEKIDKFAFSNLPLERLKIPHSVKHIGEAAFANNEKLVEVILQEGLEVIGAMAFDNCTEITHLEIPASVKAIGRDAFAGCSNVDYLVLPSKTLPRWDVVTIDDFENLHFIYVPDELVETYKKDENWGLVENEDSNIKYKPLSAKAKN
ncbi:leucine-rich repeat domain-containing protein [Capnocytophaga bilenii]